MDHSRSLLFKIPEDLYRKLKLKAFDYDLSMAEIIRRSLTEYLKRKEM